MHPPSRSGELFCILWLCVYYLTQAYMEAASLVISHAGSGSLFECLALRKAVVAVPNPVLMANHQAELADKLAADGCVACVVQCGG